MLSEKPLISVIIPTYNRAALLPRAVLSVLSQTVAHWELLIVDDGSTDSTAEILKNWQNDPRVRAFSTSNRGVSAARNHGVRQARGEWLAYLDSDDEWLPIKLEKQIEVLEQNPELLFVHGEELWVRNGVRVNPANKHQKSGGWQFLRSLELCCISPSTALFHRRLWDQHKGFDESYPVCEDYHLWLKITAEIPVGFVETPIIVKYGGHEDQLSRQLKAMDYYRVKAIDDLLRRGLPRREWRDKAREILTHKCDILLKGYEKHGSFANYQEIQDIKGYWGDRD